MGHVTSFRDGMPSLGWDIYIVYPCRLYDQFDQYSFSRSMDMVGAHQNLNGSRDLTTPLSVIVCHPWASTCYYHLVPSTYLSNLKSLSPLIMKIWKVI